MLEILTKFYPFRENKYKTTEFFEISTKKNSKIKGSKISTVLSKYKYISEPWNNISSIRTKHLHFPQAWIVVKIVAHPSFPQAQSISAF